ncbi:MAG: ribbon-helix-helix domain-containing protein [Actinomycetota bacterium]
MTTVAVRLPDEVIASIDRLIAKGSYANRTEAVKAGLAAIVQEHRRQEIDLLLTEAYSRSPETEEEIEAAASSTRALIAEEPW